MTSAELLDRIDRELSPVYVGGAVKWADDYRHFAWSKAIDKMEKALLSKDSYKIRLQLEEYVATCIQLIREYKASQKIDSEDDFISRINKEFAIR